ncbi:MAG: hypothetical protein M3121_03240 [Chloroflexota bacterium]|nr:hypothetical protein [Chloroflexota bacterium]
MTANGMGTYIIGLGLLTVVAGGIGCLGDGWRGGYALILLGLGLITVGFTVGFLVAE